MDRGLRSFSLFSKDRSFLRGARSETGSHVPRSGVGYTYISALPHLISQLAKSHQNFVLLALRILTCAKLADPLQTGLNPLLPCKRDRAMYGRRAFGLKNYVN